jgi:biopolymer transport protein ExbD
MKVLFEGSENDGRIEILPLMDVIFCILTFFILAALQLTRQQAININLPKAQSGQPQLKHERMIVSVDMIGQTYVDTKAVSRDELLSELRAYIQKDPQGVVVLNAAQTSSYNDVIQVLDLLRSVGGDRVALATSPGSANQSQPINPAPGTPGWSIEGQQRPQNSTSPNVDPALPQIPGDPGAATPLSPMVPNAPVPPAPPPPPDSSGVTP